MRLPYLLFAGLIALGPLIAGAQTMGGAAPTAPGNNPNCIPSEVSSPVVATAPSGDTGWDSATLKGIIAVPYFDSSPPPTSGGALPAPSPSASPDAKCPAPPATNLQQKILRAAEAFEGSRTCGLHGAPGSEACMASVNQILMNAGLNPLGGGADGANDIYTAITSGIASGRVIEIAQSATVPGDLSVRHSADDVWGGAQGNEHVSVCTSYGCTDVVSNSSSTCTFGWNSGYQMCYTGSPYCGGWSTFYRVQN